ncbi:MAG: hypothetical protein OEU54_14905, partial [Gemmatimonadota bacterium]|nr:hypothetical protein [Gemmatimonadota bacterium]
MLACAPLITACMSTRPEFTLPSPEEAPVREPSLDVRRAEAVERSSASAVTGDVRFLESSEGAVELGAVVIYLVPRFAPAATGVEAPPVVVMSSSTEFAPELAAVARDQPVVLANEGPVSHGLFTADLAGTRFDLPPGTRSSPVRLPPLGPLRFYCALHADETFVLYAA